MLRKCLVGSKHSINTSFHCVLAVVVVVVMVSTILIVRDQSLGIKRLHADQTDT